MLLLLPRTNILATLHYNACGMGELQLWLLSVYFSLLRLILVVSKKIESNMQSYFDRSYQHPLNL